MTRTVAVTMKRKNGSSYTTYKKPRMTSLYRSIGTPYVTKAGQRTANKIDKILSATVGSHAIETKTLDVSLSFPSVFAPIVDTFNTNDSAVILNPVQEGAGDWQRVGKRINMKSIRMRGQVTIDSVTPNVTGSSFQTINVRAVIVYFREQLTAIPDWNAVFSNISQSGVKSSGLYTPLASSAMSSCVVLLDKVYTNIGSAGISTATTYNNTHLHFDEYIDLGGAGATYQGTANPITAANIVSGMLVLYMRANLANPIANEGQATITQFSSARLRYTDV